MLVPQILPLPGAKMFTLTLRNNVIYGNLWTPGSPGSWGGWYSISSSYAADFDFVPSGIVRGGAIIMGYADSGRNIRYRTVPGPYYHNASYWSGINTLASDTGSNVVLTDDLSPNPDVYYAFYAAITGSGSTRQIRQVKEGDPNTKLNLSSASYDRDQVTTAPWSGTTVRRSFVAFRDLSNNNIYFDRARSLPVTSINSISPPDGDNNWYKTKPTITLKTEQNDNPLTTKYKWNSDNWLTYSGSINDAPDRADANTLYYYSYDPLNNTEDPIKTQTGIKVDTIAPSSLASVTATQGENNWYTSDATVSISAGDGTEGSGVSKIQHRINGGSWIDTTGASAQFTISNDGIYDIDYRARDMGGNLETFNSLEVKVDKYLPTTMLYTAPDGPNGDDGWYKTVPPILTLWPSEPGASLYQWDSTTGPWTVYLNNFAALEGTRTLNYYSTDSADNTETMLNSRDFKVDYTKPTNPTVASPSHTIATTASIDNTVDIAINIDQATDTLSGLDGYSFEWSQSADTVPDITKDFEIVATSTVSPQLMPGNWYFHLSARDVAGNLSDPIHLGPFNIAGSPAGLGPNPTYSKGIQGAANLTVNLANGNLVAQVSGPSRPARGIPVSIKHTYNSQADTDSPFGYNWTINYDRHIETADPSTAVTYVDQTGGEHIFPYDATAGAYIRPAGFFMNLVRNGDGTYTMTNKGQVESNFDSAGKLTSVVDRNNNTITLTYTAGKLTKITEASGADMTLSYQDGRLIQTTTADGRKNRYTYSAGGDLLTVVNAAEANAATFTYANHKLSSITDALSRTTNLGYTNGKLTTITDPAPLNFQVTFTYTGLITVVDGPRTDVSDITTYRINPTGLLSSVTEPAPGGTTTYEYDNDLNRTRTTNAEDISTEDTYDTNGNLLTQIDGVDATTTYTYTARNQIETVTDALGYTTINSYEAVSGNLIGTEDADHNITTYEYDQYGQKTKETNPRTYPTEYIYTSLGQIEKTIQPNDASTTTEYDGAGHAVKTTNALGVSTYYEYDPMGRVLSASLGGKQPFSLSDGSQWDYRQKITLNTDSLGLAAGSDPTLPHNIHISNNAVFNEAGSDKFWQKASSTKGNVAFTKADKSTVLNYSIKDWDYSNKDAFFDVTNTWDADADTSIYVYYGYVSGGSYPKTTSDFQNAYDSNFKAVYSMNDDPDISHIRDLSGNGYNGTKGASQAPGQSLAKAGQGQSFDGINDKIDVGDINAPIEGANDFTFSFWIKPNDVTAQHYQVVGGTMNGDLLNSGWTMILNVGADGNVIIFADQVGNGPWDLWYPGAANMVAGTYYHLALTRTGNTWQWYKNGVPLGSSVNNSVSIGAGAYNLLLGLQQNGLRALNGALDEVRLSAVSRSSNWLKLDYQSVNKQDDIGTMAAGNYMQVDNYDSLEGEVLAATASTYDAVGNQTSAVNARGKTTAYTYNKLSQLIMEEKSQVVKSWQYDAAGNVTLLTDPNENQTEYAYDPLNRLIKTIDALDNSTTVVYDAVGNKTKETDQRGAETKYKYDAAGRLTAVINAKNATSTIEYDILGRKIKETNAKKAVTEFGYDALGRMTITTDTLGHTTTYGYDEVGNQTSVIDARSKTSTSVYDSNNRVTSNTDPLFHTVSYAYDLAGQKTAETDPLNHTTTYTYDGAGRMVSSSEANGPTNYYTYDANGNKTGEAQSLEVAIADMEADEDLIWSGGSADTTYTKQANQSRKLSATDGATVSAAKGITLDWETNYRSAGNLSLWLYVDGVAALDTAAANEVILDSTGANLSNYYRYSLNGLSLQNGWNQIEIPQSSFTGVGNPDFKNITRLLFKASAKSANTVNAYFDDVRIVDAARTSAIYTYNDLDRLVSETDAKGAITTYLYDDVGNRTTVIDPAGEDTVYEYDALNREKSVTDPMGNVTSTTYDAAGNTVGQTDAEGKTTTTKYDLLGQQVKTTDPLGKVTSYEYDEVGNKIKETKSNSATISYNYDDADRMISMINELGQTTTYTLDPVGNQVGVIPPQGAATNNVYDDANRLVSSAVGGQTTTYVYGAADNKTSETKPGDKTTSYVYIELGRLGSVTDPDNKTTSFTYDITGNLLSKTESNLTVWYTYDELGNQIKMVDSRGRIKGQLKNSKGMLTSRSDINGTVGFGYNQNDWVTSQKVSGETSTTFGYDDNGARTSYKQSNNVNTAYGYDDGGKLVGLETSTSAGAMLLDFGYQYMDDFNISTETIGGQSQHYNYDNAEQLKKWTDTSGIATTYAYDNAGNRTGLKRGADTTVTFSYDTATNELTSILDGTRTQAFAYDAAGNLWYASDSSETTSYSWTGDNRLASISSSSTSATFTYDSEGKRLSKTIDGVTTKFVYDDINLIAELNASDTITAKYFYDDTGQLVSMKKGGQTYYFHLNHRGDVIKITDANENVVASYSYDPWGNILSSSGTFAAEQPFRYASYYWDSEISMYYLINRYYDPKIGRFISKDPASDPEDMDLGPEETNGYAYSDNNPIMGVDPDGLYWDGNPNYHRLLYYGSRGEDVKWVQNRLQAAGFDQMLAPYYTDGIFGGQTRAAVIAFQQKVGIGVDGVVGTTTWGKLEPYQGPARDTNPVGPPAPAPVAAPAPAPAPAPQPNQNPKTKTSEPTIVTNVGVKWTQRVTYQGIGNRWLIKKVVVSGTYVGGIMPWNPTHRIRVYVYSRGKRVFKHTKRCPHDIFVGPPRAHNFEKQPQHTWKPNVKVSKKRHLILAVGEHHIMNYDPYRGGIDPYNAIIYRTRLETRI